MPSTKPPLHWTYKYLPFICPLPLSPEPYVIAPTPETSAQLERHANFTFACPVRGKDHYERVHLPFPPLPPTEFIRSRAQFYDTLLWRCTEPAHLQSTTPIIALYRIYEYMINSMEIGYRKEFAAFWNHGSLPLHGVSWFVRDIPDPKDPNPERYALLAVITLLLVESFNQRLSMGLSRDEYTDATMILEKRYLRIWWWPWATVSLPPLVPEEPLSWTPNVPPLDKPLNIAYWDEGKFANVQPDAPLYQLRICRQHAKYNIISFKPNIHFT